MRQLEAAANYLKSQTEKDPDFLPKLLEDNTEFREAFFKFYDKLKEIYGEVEGRYLQLKAAE